MTYLPMKDKDFAKGNTFYFVEGDRSKYPTET